MDKAEKVSHRKSDQKTVINTGHMHGVGNADSLCNHRNRFVGTRWIMFRVFEYQWFLPAATRNSRTNVAPC